MGFADHLDELCLGVRDVLVGPVPLDAADLPAAVSAHHALVNLLRQLQPQVTGGGDAVTGSLWSGVEDVETRPVAVLARLLARHPGGLPSAAAAIELSPTDVQVHRPANDQGARWQRVHRHATVLMGLWDASVSDRRSVSTRPHGEGEWTLTAHVAGLAEALSVLDHDLGRALALAGEPRHARVLQHAGSSGLRTTAAAVSDLATAGPLPRVQVYARVERPLFVGAAQDVHPGQYRLAMLMRRQDVDLHPEDLDLVVRSQYHAARAAAGILTGHDPAVAALLGDYAEALTRVTPALRRSLGGRDSAAVAQARTIATYLAGWAATASLGATTGAPPATPSASAPPSSEQAPSTAADAAPAVVRAAAGFARGVPAVARAMSATGSDRVRNGSWIVDVSATDVRPGAGPVGGRSVARPRWARHTLGTPLPLLDRLTDVAAAVGALRAQQPTANSSPHARRFEAARTRPSMQDGLLMDPGASPVTQLREATRSRTVPQRPGSPSERLQRPNQDVVPTPSGGHLLSQGQVELLEQVASGRPMRAIYASRRSSAETLQRELTHAYRQLGCTDPQVGTGTEAAGQASRALEVLAALDETGRARVDLVKVEGARPGFRRTPEQQVQLQHAGARLTWAQKRLDAARVELQRLNPDPPEPQPRRHRRPPTPATRAGRAKASEQQAAERARTGASRPSAPRR